MTPDRITVLRTMHGDMSMSSDGRPLNADIGDRHVEYVRADLHAALCAEVERLTRERNEADAEAQWKSGAMAAAEADAAAAREQVRKLMEVLEVDPWKVGFAHWKALRARAAPQGEGER